MNRTRPNIGQPIHYIERFRLDDEVAIRIEPLSSRPIAIEFDSIAIGVPQVYGHCGTVISSVVDEVAMIQKASHGACQ